MIQVFQVQYSHQGFVHSHIHSPANLHISSARCHSSSAIHSTVPATIPAILIISHSNQCNAFRKTVGVGNHSVMTALDAGCARSTRPHWYAYALAKGRASYQKVFTLLFVISWGKGSPKESCVERERRRERKDRKERKRNNQLWSSSSHNTNFVSPLKPFHSAA